MVKNRLVGLISLIGMTVAYWLLRFPLFALHGMKEWPFYLFMAGAIVIAIFGILCRCQILSILTASGYILGFFIGYLFQTNNEIGENSLWLIWTCSYAAMILAGAGMDIVKRHRSKKKSEA